MHRILLLLHDLCVLTTSFAKRSFCSLIACWFRKSCTRMYLSKLELHGFKSFADRTVVDFAPGVTCVVGPNGCGKSNIVDAVRWVIGEQRARILRSDKMDNVIFNGTSKRRALGMSEVMLTIENTRGILPIEYSEVTIGRRLFRSGESEYLLNGVQCRLKDITDLFMDTGMGAGAYSVIELKMIEELLSDNAQDRRHLFEEAAGITKYKIRRGQTLRKLKTTQVDLDRVRDLTDELDKRVKSLERQARKTARYKEFETELRDLELSLATLEFLSLGHGISESTKARTVAHQEAEAFGARVSAQEAAHEALQKEYVDREKRVSEGQTRLSRHIDRLRAAESDLRVGTERLTVLARDLTRLAEEEKTNVARRDLLVRVLERSRQDLESAQPAATSAEAALTDARRIRDEAQNTQQKHQAKLHSLRQEERNALAERAARERHVDRLATRVEVITAEMEERRGARETLGAGNDDMEARLRAAREAANLARKALVAAQDEVDRRVAARTGAEETLRAAREASRGAERAYDAAAAEAGLLLGLVESFDDLGETVRFLAQDTDWTDGDLVTVADVMGCDAEWKAAVDTALGNLASCIVVTGERELEAAVAKLRHEGKGQASFIVLERLPGHGPDSDSAKQIPAARGGAHATSPVGAGLGSAAPLLGVVRVSEPRYEVLARALFHDTWVVDSIDGVRAPSGARIVARTGEWTGDSGVVHAGSRREQVSVAASRMGRREQLARLEKEVARLEAAVGQADEHVREAEWKLGALDVGAARRALDTARSEHTTADKALSRAEYEAETAGRRRKEIDERLATLEEQRTATITEKEGISASLKQVSVQVADIQKRRSEAEESFGSIEEASREAFDFFNEANITAVQTRNRLDNLKRDIQRNQDDLNELERREKERAEAIVALSGQQAETTERCATLEKDLEKLLAARSAIEKEVSAAKDELMESRVQISDIEAALRGLRREREAALKLVSSHEVRLAELETRREDLCRTMLEDFEVDLEDEDSLEREVPDEFDRTAARERVQDLKSKIRQMGPVNALALESFEEEKERLTFLTEQLADLEGAEETLLKTIGEINTTASERFHATFGAIQENFRRLFAELFGEGASADVVLADPDDPLEADIEIFAKPLGKKPSVLAQLSGGEKTLTAIALLFSIYLVKPSPFCILDEVDAPLDDANVGRFMHLIRSFSDSTQFILVTHNKRTMEAADRMYGITMREQGVSRLVGVTFEDGLDMVA